MPNGKIFIAGCGGLGSNLALMLARSGFRHFILADFDVIEPSNLNRQHYFPKDIGRAKAATLAGYLRMLNVDIETKIIDQKLCEDNLADLIDADCDAVCECFDDPSCKAQLTRFMLGNHPDTLFAAVSGVAGIRADALRIKQKGPNFFLVTDEGLEGDVKDSAVFAPKVIAAAALQASIIMRKLCQ